MSYDFTKRNKDLTMKMLYPLRIFIIFCVSLISLTHGSVKKGIGVGPKGFLCDDFKALNNMYWWYDWGANLDKIRKNSNCSNIDRYIDNFIPMIWGRWTVYNVSIPDKAAYLLGFNEPNHFEQSNLSAKEAASYWPDIEKLSKGRLLISPAAAPCGGLKCHGNTTQWFDEFFKYCSGCRVDYLATHYYSCNVDNTMAYLKDLFERYGKKIWLTEFACPYSTSTTKELNFMREILPKLESAPFVFRYAWFASRIKKGTFVTPASSLLEPNSSTLTTLGDFYNDFVKYENIKGSFWWFKILVKGLWWIWNIS